MIYLLAALLPPIGLLLNGQPFSAIFNLLLLVFCVVFGLFFHVLLLVPSAHAVIAVHMKRGAPAPGNGGGDPSIWPAAGLSALIGPIKAGPARR